MSSMPRTRVHFPRMKVRGGARRRRRVWAILDRFAAACEAAAAVQASFARMFVEAVTAACAFDAVTSRLAEEYRDPVFDMPDYPALHPVALAEVDRG